MLTFPQHLSLTITPLQAIPFPRLPNKLINLLPGLRHYIGSQHLHNHLNMLKVPDLSLTITLLQAIPFPRLPNKLINLLLIRKRLGHTLLLQSPLSPCNNLRALCLYVDIAKDLIDNEPAVEGDKRKVHKPNPKVRFVTKLPLQYLEGFNEFLLA